jgi:hypothetical protein
LNLFLPRGCDLGRRFGFFFIEKFTAEPALLRKRQLTGFIEEVGGGARHVEIIAPTRLDCASGHSFHISKEESERRPSCTGTRPRGFITSAMSTGSVLLPYWKQTWSFIPIEHDKSLGVMAEQPIGSPVRSGSRSLTLRCRSGRVGGCCWSRCRRTSMWCRNRVRRALRGGRCRSA